MEHLGQPEPGHRQLLNDRAAIIGPQVRVSGQQAATAQATHLEQQVFAGTSQHRVGDECMAQCVKVEAGAN